MGNEQRKTNNGQLSDCMGEGVRSCLEFISEVIQGIFPGILFHLLRSIASYVTKKMGQKGGNRPE